MPKLCTVFARIDLVDVTWRDDAGFGYFRNRRNQKLSAGATSVKRSSVPELIIGAFTETAFEITPSSCDFLFHFFCISFIQYILIKSFKSTSMKSQAFVDFNMLTDSLNGGRSHCDITHWFVKCCFKTEEEQNQLISMPAYVSWWLRWYALPCLQLLHICKPLCNPTPPQLFLFMLLQTQSETFSLLGRAGPRADPQSQI